MSPDGKPHSQIEHILEDRRRHSNVLDVRSFRAADCDSDRYLVVAKIRERLAVNKQRSQRFDMERLNLLKLNKVHGKEQYRSEVPKSFTTLADLDAEMEINSVKEKSRENIQILDKESLGYFKLKKHKLQFDKRCSK
jgi:hypothetical protein